jgi:hypothetical protein
MPRCSRKKRRRIEVVAELNEEQRRFVDALLDASLVLRAGAGSGKTHTLIARIVRLLQAGVTVLVFSHANKTVDEIKERLGDLAGDATVLTMHKYCMSRMCDAKLPMPHSPDAIMEEAAQAFEAGLLETFESHIIVDEANDLSSEQMRIVMCLFSRGHHVTLVGDMEQSIYGFQGSSPAHLKCFEEKVPSDCRFELCTNYRSSNSLIVDVANAIAEDDIRDGNAVFMRPHPGASPAKRPRVCAYGEEKDLLELLLEEIRALLFASRASESIMILAHSNDLLGMAHCHLMAHRISAVLHSSKRSAEFRRIPPRLRRNGVVQMLTIHGAKGGEADHVFLLSGDDKGEPRETEGAEGSESRRMLYVACTRARLSLNVFYRESLRRQPCRWLSAAWHLMETRGATKFSSTLHNDYRAEKNIFVTHLLKENGADGLHNYFFEEGSLESTTHYSTAIIDLEDSDDLGECIAKQAHKAYHLGLEMFMGKLFELHAAVVFDRPGVLEMAKKLAIQASCMFINKELFQYLQSPEGRAWWQTSGGVVLRHLYHCLSEADGCFESVEMYDRLPVPLRASFSHAFNQAGWKFQGYDPLRTYFQMRVRTELDAIREQGASYSPLPWETFFRAYFQYWDNGSYLVLRETHSRAFQAVLRVCSGSDHGDDLCLFAALACCWEPQMRNRPNPEAWQPLLHLAQTSESLVHLSVKDLKLSDKAAEQIRHDARRIQELLGEPLGLEVQNAVVFSCRSDYGDRELLARGTVRGRADVMFQDGPLEIKAVKMRLQAEHSAQALWYACARGAPKAWLWDIYRRRLLVWEVPSDPSRFLKKCILAYLKYNAPPDSAKRVWPQEVHIHE